MTQSIPLVKRVEDIPFEPVPQAKSTHIKWIFSPKDNVPNFSMRLFRVEAGGNIPEHSHPWEHEIFVLKGKGRIRIGTQTFEIAEGDAIYVPPDIPHEYDAYEEVLLLCMIPNEGVPPERR